MKENIWLLVIALAALVGMIFTKNYNMENFYIFTVAGLGYIITGIINIVRESK